MSNKFIYFDHAATTPLDPEVFTAMMPYFTELYGNPSSIYQFAQKARQAVDRAREVTAKILECAPREIIFTGSGTESNNLFIRGAAEEYQKFGRHIITTKIEHDSVLKTCEYLEQHGFEVTYLDVGGDGIVSPEDVIAALRDDTIFISIMYANNEIGTIQPIKEIALSLRGRSPKQSRLLRPKGLAMTESPRNDISLPLLHTDACQAAPYLDISVKNLGVDALTLNGGKIYGPKGVGALFLKEGVEIVPQIFGGGQEHRKRSGTENVPAIVGFSSALELVQKNREEESRRVQILRDKLIDGILKIPDTRLNGDHVRRLPNNVNVSFRGLEGEAILLKLDMLGIAASAGSACTSGSLEVSHVIRALGLTDEWNHSGTRFSLGHGNTEEQIDFLLKNLPGLIKNLREISPFI